MSLTRRCRKVSKDDFIGMVQVAVVELAVGENKELTLSIVNLRMMHKLRNQLLEAQAREVLDLSQLCTRAPSAGRRDAGQGPSHAHCATVAQLRLGREQETPGRQCARRRCLTWVS
eukprot:750678-Hanusia_phi.AAC.1